MSETCPNTERICALPAAEVPSPPPAGDLLELLASSPPPTLPSTCLLSLGHQISSLKNRLKKVSTTTGDGVARAFLKAQAAFFGSYRNALKIEPVSNFLACYNPCLVRAKKRTSGATRTPQFAWLLNSPRRGEASVRLWKVLGGREGPPVPCLLAQGSRQAQVRH